MDSCRRASRRLRPDVTDGCADARLGRLEATSLGRRRPDDEVLDLTTFDIDEYVIEAIRAGASGFLLKDVRPERADRSDPDPRTGRCPPRAFGDATTPGVDRPFAAGAPAGQDGLARRADPHRAQGARARGSRRLRGRDRRQALVADTTVRTHIRHILEKLALRDRVQAVVLAYDTGLVQPQAS